PAELPRRTIPQLSATDRSTLETDKIPNPKSQIPNPQSAIRNPQSANTSATSKSAALKVEIAGPQGVTVGKPALYVVTVSNESDVAAEELHVRLPLPACVTVQATQPTSGEATVQADAGSPRVAWLVSQVPARSRE